MPEPQFHASLQDVPAALHIHTRYSDGHGTIPAIARIAARQGIRVLYITDHDTLDGQRHGEAGWHGQTLVLIGEELTSRAGHVVTLNIAEPIPPDQPTDQAMAAIAAQDGLSFIAHPYWSGEPWRDWPSADAATGLELYNLAHDAHEESRLKLLVTAVPLPGKLFAPHILDRPAQALARWDDMTRQRRVVGVAGNDAHGLQWTPLVRLAPYDLSLACVRTHLLMPEITPEAVHQALANGRAFIGFDLLGNTGGFTFALLHNDQAIATMGEETTMRDGLSLYLWTPRRCTMQVLRDGQPIATVEGYEHRLPVSEPGVYRVEASLRGELWIISNPIYIRESPGPTHP